MEIRKVGNTNIDFLELCKKLNDTHNKIVAEQRQPNANCCIGNEKYTNIYIMYNEKTAVGCIASTDVKNETVEIGRVYVCEEYRKQGIATKLFENVEKIAKKNGAKILKLDTYERLVDAIKLYKKLGFKIVEPFPEIKDSPYSICMSKTI